LTDSPVSASEPQPRRFRWRRFVLWGFLAVFVVLFFEECARLDPTQAAVLPSGQRIEIIQFTRYEDLQIKIPGRVRTLRGLLIDYYPLAANPDSLPAEAERVFALARSEALQGGDSLIIVRQTVPFISRLLWFDRRYDYYYGLDSNGGWRRFQP
jgi:hypothetical protein